jgi:hypothetical protein
VEPLSQTPCHQSNYFSLFLNAFFGAHLAVLLGFRGIFPFPRLVTPNCNTIFRVSPAAEPVAAGVSLLKSFFMSELTFAATEIFNRSSEGELGHY